MLKYFACAVLSVFLCGVAAEASENSEARFARVWTEIGELSEKAREKFNDADRNKKTALEFMTGRAPYYARLLNDAIEILGVSEASEYINTINELRLKERRLDEEETTLKRKRVAAPASSWNPLADTKKSIDARLAAIPREKAEGQEQIGDLTERAREALAGEGVNLSGEEINYFVVSAEGNELLALMNMAGNMKKLQRVMERELEANPGDINLARIYTGMYLLCLDAWSQAHKSALEKFADYRAKVKNYRAVAEKNLLDARSARGSASAEDRGAFEPDRGYE